MQFPQRRCGRVIVSSLFFNDSLGNVLDAYEKIFSGVAIIGCNYEVFADRFEYFVIGPQFRPLAVGEKIPEYSVTIDGDSCTFKECPNG